MKALVIAILLLLLGVYQVWAATNCSGPFGQGPFGSATTDTVVAPSSDTGTFLFVDGTGFDFVDGTHFDFVN